MLDKPWLHTIKGEEPFWTAAARSASSLTETSNQMAGCR